MRILIQILFLLCALWPSLIAGQPDLQIKAGVNRSSLDWEYKDYRFGFHAGGAARFDLSPGFYLQPEILFSVKGTKIREDIFVSPDLTLEYAYEYIALPVIAGLRLGDGASLQIGPEINFLLGGSLNTTGSPARLKGFLQDKDIGILVGLAFHLGSRWEIGLRYYYGLTDIPEITLVEASGQPLFLIPRGNNRNLQLSVGCILVTD